MPFTHVTPGCAEPLQGIADSLWKSKKVVVVTGAGISTNSGIPVSLLSIVKHSVIARLANLGRRISDQNMACIP